ncbi:MAG: nucleotide exchange factor GrpE [Candidatus Thorarchaeota archaeon]
MQEKHNNDKDIEEVSLEIEEDEDGFFEIIPEDENEALLDEAECKSDELLDKLQRLQAEFDNYRKRMESRFAETARFATEGILLKVLDVHDNLVRALEANFSLNPESIKQGISAIEQQLTKILQQENIRPIESVGKLFDPYYQHAVIKTSDPSTDDGLVVEEFQKGYMFHDKVLRPALVCVNRHEDPSKESISTDDEKEKGR